MAPKMFLGTLKGTYRVCSRYIRIPGLRAHTAAHGFNLRELQYDRLLTQSLSRPASYRFRTTPAARTLVVQESKAPATEKPEAVSRVVQ